MHAKTRRVIFDALRGEALSVVRLHAYANKAEEDGHGAAAERLRRLESLNLDHATALLHALGWVGDLQDNVLGLVVGDTPVHALPYARYAYEARQAGDDATADLFVRLSHEETEAGLILLDVLDQPRATMYPEVSHDPSSCPSTRRGLSAHHEPATTIPSASASLPTA